jgi:hypothetical protein
MWTGQASQFRHPARKQLLVADVIVDHEVSLPAFEEGARMRTGAAGLIVEHHDGRADVEIVRAVGP